MPARGPTLNRRKLTKERGRRKTKIVSHAGSEVLRRPGSNRATCAKNPGLRSTSDPAWKKVALPQSYNPLEGARPMPIIVCPKCGAKNRVDDVAAVRLQPVCGRCGTRLGEQ